MQELHYFKVDILHGLGALVRTLEQPTSAPYPSPSYVLGFLEANIELALDQAYARGVQAANAGAEPPSWTPDSGASKPTCAVLHAPGETCSWNNPPVPPTVEPQDHES